LWIILPAIIIALAACPSRMDGLRFTAGVTSEQCPR
jgi:hypothetical protein